MGILWALLIGLLVGGLAKLLMPGKDPGGVILTMLLGVAGSAIAFLIGRALGGYGDGQTPGLIASVLGAMLVLGGYRIVYQRTRTP